MICSSVINCFNTKLVFKFISSLFLICLFFTSCKKSSSLKDDILFNHQDNLYSADAFFKQSENLPATVSRILLALKNKETKYPFASKFVKLQGVPLWKNATIQIKPNFNVQNNINGSDSIVKIPLQLQGYQTVHGYLLCKISNNVITAAVIDSRQYAAYGFQSSSQNEIVSENIVSEIMHFNHVIFGLNDFKITDNRLFGNNDPSTTLRTVRFDTNLNNPSIAGRGNGLCPGGSITIYVTSTSFHCTNTGDCTSGICDNCSQCRSTNTNIYSYCSQDEPPTTSPQVPYTTIEDPTDPGGGGPIPPGWVPTPEDPCLTTVAGNTQTTICGMGWELELTDENGYLYSRIALLDSLLKDPYATLPCDSLEMLNTYGIMFQSVGNYNVPMSVKNRLDSIKNSTANFDTSSLFVQTLNNASGAVVNCDFFPLKINQLPINNLTGIRFTPNEFLEFFRKNIDSFSTPAAKFSPYNSGGLNDVAQYNKDSIKSLGAIVHIDMVQDGSVILSGYQNAYSPVGYQSHNFIFSTLVTPFDGYHPISGNRKFGIYTDNSGGFVFFTMGVDRISRRDFEIGNNIKDFFGASGFEIADALWTGMQQNVINYINNSGGSAQNYSRPNYTARPNYADVEQFLLGNISYQQLKEILCP